MWTDSVPTSYIEILDSPHVLIAGATGSGKSVLLNGLIATAAMQKGQFIMIDPKRVELRRWKSLPGIIRYASDVQDSVSALRYVLGIIERRFREMEKNGLVKYETDPVYICIDELADLMTTCKKEVLPILQRIGQIGRAANVHMIGCTQCVNTTVLPTQLLVNFDCRVCLRTATAHHSRMIIGQSGAESFPNPMRDGKADMWVRSSMGLERYPIVMITSEVIADIVSSAIQYCKKKKRFRLWVA